MCNLPFWPTFLFKYSKIELWIFSKISSSYHLWFVSFSRLFTGTLMVPSHWLCLGPGSEPEPRPILCRNLSHWLCLGPGLDTWKPLKHNWNRPPKTVSRSKKWVHNPFFPIPVQAMSLFRYSEKGSTFNHTTHSSIWWSRSLFRSWGQPMWIKHKDLSSKRQLWSKANLSQSSQ